MKAFTIMTIYDLLKNNEDMRRHAVAETMTLIAEEKEKLGSCWEESETVSELKERLSADRAELKAAKEALEDFVAHDWK